MIKLESICKSYDGHKVLDNFDLTLEDGSRTAIMGPSGCGKTTLFMIIAGLAESDSGKITGTDNMRFSAVFQDDRLCENLSLYANIKMVCEKNVSKSDILTSLNELGLNGFENKYAGTLSGGMKRRASVIRAMLAKFDTLILDEPFNGLDRDAKTATAKYILKKLNGRTLIIITHNKDDAELLGCDTININT